ncbi:MAG: DUF255 domain-containing protein [Bacteroidota bacterium]
MKLNYSYLLIGVLVLASAFTVKSIITPSNLSNNEKKIQKWHSVEEAVSLAKTDQKKILIDVYTDWCRWCKVMDQKTFSEAEVSKYLSENYHLAKFNAEQKEELSFNGKKYTFKLNGKRGYHEFAADILNGQLAYPSLVIFDSNLNKIEVVRGFKSPEELMKILKENT